MADTGAAYGKHGEQILEHHIKLKKLRTKSSCYSQNPGNVTLLQVCIAHQNSNNYCVIALKLLALDENLLPVLISSQ